MQVSNTNSYNVWTTSTKSTAIASHTAKTQIQLSSTQHTTQSAKSVAQNTSADSLSLSEDYLDFASFLEKVQEGTVSEDDLSEMQEQFAAQGGQMMPPPMMQPPEMSAQASEDVDSLSTFLSKMQSGTATEDDLKSIQDVLTRMQAGAQNAGASAAQTQDDILTMESFLEKVRAGTVSDTDLEQMQELLSAQQTEEKTETQGTRPMGPPPMQGPPPPRPADSTGSTEAAEEDDTISNLLDYLGKIEDGSATQEDIDSLGEILQDISAQESDSSNTGSFPDSFAKMVLSRYRNSYSMESVGVKSDVVA